MRRFELYVGNNDRLVLSEFKDIESEYESRIFKGKETFEIIKRLASSKLVDFSELRRGNDLILEYKNYIVNVSDYKDVFRKNGLGPLLKNIKDFEEEPILSVNKNKKVKRKNKHTARKVVAAGLTVLMLYAVGNNLIKKEETMVSNTNPAYSTQQEIEQDFVNFAQTIAKPEQTIKESTQTMDSSSKDNILSLTLNYPDWSKEPKANTVKAYYGDMISKYARMYGIDPKLAIAVATQETDTGIHRSTMDDGGATGLMQIQNDVWIGEYVTAYNFETKSMESVEVTNSNIGEVENNIKMGCMILQNAMEYMDHNILAGIQCYNMGYGNVNSILDAYSKYSGKSRNSILKDVNDIGWMDFRQIIKVGEPNYVEKVFSWMGEDNTVKNIKRDGTLVSITVGNQTESKKVY